MTASQTRPNLNDPVVVRLNLPPELARTMMVSAGIVLLLAVLLGWGLWRYARAASAPPTVKIGLVAPFEGLYRNTGYDVLFAVKQAIAERNEGEGLNGYRVELVALNDFNDPAEAARQAQALAADAGVVGVVGHFSAEATLAALPVYHQAGLVLVAPWSLDDAAFELGNVVSVAATTAETEARLQREIEQRGLSPAAELAQPGDTPPPAAPAVVLNTDAVTAANLLLNLPANLPKFGQAATGDRQLVQVAGPAANGLVFVSPGPATAEGDGSDSFSQTYQAAAGYPPPPRAILAYDATQILLDALAQTMKLDNKWYNQTTQRTAISQNLAQVARPGLTGPIAFGADGRRINAPVWVYQISEVRYPGNSIDR